MLGVQADRREPTAVSSARLSWSAAWLIFLAMKPLRLLLLGSALAALPAQADFKSDLAAIRQVAAGQLVFPQAARRWLSPSTRGPNDSLTSNTALGRAVASACEELEVLADLERDAADRAAALLRKLGYRGSLLDRDAAGGGGGGEA